MSQDTGYSPQLAALRLIASSRAPATTGDVVDAALMARIGAGDRRAMQVLYARHHARIRRFILGLAGTAAVADELLHEVFLDVWRKAGRFAGSRVSTWLIALARHKAIQASRSRPNAPLGRGLAESLDDPAENLEVIADEKKTEPLQRHFVAQELPLLRLLIDLVYYRGRAIDAAAASVGLAHNTVKARTFYARRRLAKLLRLQRITALPVV